jgi:hypothetical protein
MVAFIRPLALNYCPKVQYRSRIGIDTMIRFKDESLV